MNCYYLVSLFLQSSELCGVRGSHRCVSYVVGTTLSPGHKGFSFLMQCLSLILKHLVENKSESLDHPLLSCL